MLLAGHIQFLKTWTMMESKLNNNVQAVPFIWFFQVTIDSKISFLY